MRQARRSSGLALTDRPFLWNPHKVLLRDGNARGTDAAQHAHGIAIGLVNHQQDLREALSAAEEGHREDVRSVSLDEPLGILVPVN